ncbi:DNA alkylation repair protein [Pedobacter sp. P351]|uniref:DNA alkylation repair protein n=1 Tax=Pedobacter superstes TaxID=3133441 RepID=UPI0030B1F724
MENLLKQIREELINLGDESVRKSSQKFFKEPIKAYGVKVPAIKSLTKSILKDLQKESKENIFKFCEVLWASGYFEESIIACDLAYSQRKKFEKTDFKIFEKWISCCVDNWASCDTFCNNTVGSFLLMYPEYVSDLKKWGTDENRWMRRAASVSFIVPARKGKYVNEIMEIAELQLSDKDDLVQKGYGWALKVASKTHENTVFNFVMQNKLQMPRTAFRYAIENMSAELKARAMAK